MNTDCLLVDLQGFKSFKNEFIIKEFAFSTNEYTQVFLIKPPYKFSSLSDSEKRHVRWIEKNKGILWCEGYIDYREFRRMIHNYLVGKIIFVKGFEKIKWVNDLCIHCSVIDLGEKHIPNLQSLYEKYGTENEPYNCVYHKKVCALKNVICMKKFCYDCPHVFIL